MGDSETELTSPPSLVSVIVPAYNEGDNIPSCVEQVSEAMRDAGYKAEIIIVNDGSTDNTLSIARSLQMKCPSLRVLDLKRNYGKTTALKEGIRVAKGDAVAFFDADMQYDATDLVKLVGLMSYGTDVANGRRDFQAYELTRTAFSRIYNAILRLVFRLNVTDSNCGVKVLTRRAADPDILFRYGLPLVVPLLKVRGFRLSETAVSLRLRRAGESKYFKNGSFLGGWNNIRDISYHSGMLLGLLASLPIRRLERLSKTTDHS
jgi:glycosyltransferase involved in cell wall biosynthesis